MSPNRLSQGLDEMPNTETAIAVLRTAFDAHVKSDDERYDRIENNTTQIMTSLSDIRATLNNSFQRAHERIDDEVSKARHALNNAATVADAKIHLVDKRVDEAETGLSAMQTKYLVAVIALLITIVGFFLVPFFMRH